MRNPVWWVIISVFFVWFLWCEVRPSIIVKLAHEYAMAQIGKDMGKAEYDFFYLLRCRDLGYDSFKK